MEEKRKYAKVVLADFLSGLKNNLKGYQGAIETERKNTTYHIDANQLKAQLTSVKHFKTFIEDNESYIKRKYKL